MSFRSELSLSHYHLQLVSLCETSRLENMPPSNNSSIHKHSSGGGRSLRSLRLVFLIGFGLILVTLVVLTVQRHNHLTEQGEIVLVKSDAEGGPQVESPDHLRAGERHVGFERKLIVQHTDPGSELPSTSQPPVPMPTDADVVREGNCAGFPGVAPRHAVDLAAKAKDVTTRTVSDVLIEQLANYSRRVQGKLATRNKKLWQPYLSTEIQEKDCISRFPECATFTRDDVKKAIRQRTSGGSDNSSALEVDMSQFMLKKCCIEHGELYDAMSYFADFMRSQKVEFWLTAGTLLGAVREGGTLISWDTDIDILIQQSDVERVSRQLSSTHPPGSGGHRNFYKEYRKDHAHGHILGVVYGTPEFRHEEASRVEIWVRQESKKMQKSAINFPTQPCYLYDVLVACPSHPISVLEHGYGSNWCRPCKHKTSNCKEVNTVAHSA